MDQTRKQFEDQPTPATGIAGDMKRLHGDASATAAELREFVATLKGRSPAEVLGKIGESSLFQGIVQASIGCAVLLIALTVVPYLVHGPNTGLTKEQEAAVRMTAEMIKANQEEQNAEASQAETAAAETDASAEGGSEVEKAAKAMGIDETRQAAPGVNPLDKNLDSLLDGVD